MRLAVRKYRTEKSVSRELWPFEAPPLPSHVPPVKTAQHIRVFCASNGWLATASYI